MRFLQLPLDLAFEKYRYVLIIFLQICYLVSNVSSAFDPGRRHYRENFDPQEADPRRNISCVGDSYDFKLPLLDGFNPNGLSMQTICAKPQYGGGGRYQHAGAYCYYPIERTRNETSSTDSQSDVESGSSESSDFQLPQTLQWMLRGKIVFDNHPGSQTSHQLQNPRVMQACLYRCFCNYELDDVSNQPQSNHFAVRDFPSAHGYQLEIDVNNDFTTPYDQKRSRSPLNGGDIPMYKRPQIDRQGLGVLARPTYMNLHPANKITCTGDLPTFLLPTPYTRETFSSMQDLCAVVLSGGNK